MDAQEELAFLRSVAASQLQTIKTLTLGCEKYGLTETTPIVRHLAAQDDEIERLRAELSELRDKLKVCFPLLDEVGLEEEIHCCEWILQQERKRLHAALAAKEE